MIKSCIEKAFLSENSKFSAKGERPEGNGKVTSDHIPENIQNHSVPESGTLGAMNPTNSAVDAKKTREVHLYDGQRMDIDEFLNLMESKKKEIIH